jgi:ABC-type amino acid transport substrate-binding protein
MRRLLQLVPVVALCAVLAAGGCPEPPPPTPPGPRYTVYLTDAGPEPAAVVAAIVSLRGFEPKVAEGLVKRLGKLPSGIPALVDADAEAAERAAQALRAAGGEAVVAERP